MLILDTDHASALVRGHPAVRERIVALGVESFGMSSITLGEMLHGARYKGSAKLEGAIWALGGTGIVLPADSRVANHYASIRSRLWKIGKPIPENDIWIAATASLHGAILVTGDGHFSGVVEIKTENWLRPEGKS